MIDMKQGCLKRADTLLINTRTVPGKGPKRPIRCTAFDDRITAIPQSTQAGGHEQFCQSYVDGQHNLAAAILAALHTDLCSQAAVCASGCHLVQARQKIAG